MKLTLQTLAQLIHDRFQIDHGLIVPDASLDELGFDSLSQIDLAVLLQKKAGVTISDAKLNEISKIADILVFANEGV